MTADRRRRRVHSRRRATNRRKATRRGPRRIDYPRHGKAGVRRWLPSWRLGLGTLLTCFSMVVGLFIALYAYVDIPVANAEVRQESNVYYWADGSHMVSVGPVNRRNVSLSEVPASVRNSVLAAENADFYNDSGVSLSGLGRAAINMARGKEAQGGSTITQQYVKNTYLSQEQTLSRKAKEFFIALKLDRHSPKDTIFQGYLNTSWFGRGAYGVQAASNAYYDVDVDELDPGQSAFLAALLKGGNGYDPALGDANRARAVERWSWILDRQVTLGLMDARERARYTRFPEPSGRALSTNLSGQTGYLVDLAKRYVKKQTGLADEDLDRGGYQIHTTFEKDAVRRLERSVRNVLDRDIDPEGREADQDVQVGSASVRPGDGAVVAVYGGPDATEHFTNNADTSGVPAGSVFKPFVLAAALQHGVRLENGSTRLVSPESYYTASGILADTPRFVGDRFALFPPRPESGDVTTLREAMTASANNTFSLLGAGTGLKRVEDMAVAAGMLKGSMAPRDKEFPLGTSSPSAIRVATSYATLAANGVRHEPYSVTKVLRNGKPLTGFSRQPGDRAMEERVARSVTSVLKDGATARAASTTPGRFAGASTGDRETQRVAWYAGYSDDLATAVTLFRSRPGQPLQPLADTGGKKSVHASVLPARIWAAYIGVRSP